MQAWISSMQAWWFVVCISQVVGLETVLGTEKYWSLMLSLSLIPATLQYISLPFCPKSPRFLFINRGKEKEAEAGEFMTVPLGQNVDSWWPSKHVELSVKRSLIQHPPFFLLSALRKLRGNPEMVMKEMEEMREEAAHSETGVTVREFLKKKRYRQPIILVLIINLGSQLSGFNAVGVPTEKSFLCLNVHHCNIWFKHDHISFFLGYILSYISWYI